MRMLRSCAALLALAAAADAQQVQRGPYLQLSTPTSIRVRWRTDLPVVGVVRYGPSPGQWTATASETAAATDHDVAIAGLSPSSRAYYAVGTAAQVLAGGDADHFFVAQPAPGAPVQSRLWVIGDSGTANADAARVRDAYREFTGLRDTDLWLMLGDNAYDMGTDAQYQAAMFAVYAPLLARSVVWPAYGNHDAMTSDAATQTGPYFDAFALPAAGEAGGTASGTEAWYSFDHGGVHFVCLDSAESDATPGGPMAAWLAQDLAQDVARFTVAYWHHPPYTKGTHDSDVEADLIAMRATFGPILEAGGVDLVLCGHSHGYERSFLLDSHYGSSTTFGPANQVDAGDGAIGGDGAYAKPGLVPAPHQGTVYVVCGCSGKTGDGTFDHPAMRYSEKVLGSVVLDVNGDQLDLRFLDDVGAVHDRFTLVKGGQSPVALEHEVVVAASTWRWRAAGTAAPAEWNQPGFDDSAWSAGPGPLGYGDPFIATTVPFGSDASHKYVTTYFRRSFVLAGDLADVESLRAGVNFDDGFVLYLDGVEIARRALPSGAIAYATLASLHEGGRYEVVDLSAHAAAFTAGPHVLAAEVHQQAVTSSDLAFDLRLDYDRFEPYLPPCAAGDYPGDALHVNGSSGGFARSVDVAIDAPLEIALASPSGPPRPFVLLAEIGPVAHPPGIAALGSLCLAPQYFVANSLAPSLGSLLPATATPWSFALPPLGVSIEFTMQAIFFEPGLGYRTSNAVHVRSGR